MLTTYTLYAHRHTDAATFEPLTGTSPFEALKRAQEMMAHDPKIHRIDVHLGDAHLFSVARP